MHDKAKKEQGLKLLIMALVLGVIVLILYWRYVTGEYLFLFPNVVNDGVTQFLPRYLKLARLYSNEGKISGYTLSDGFGGWLSIGRPFELLIIMFGEEAVPYLIGVKEVICVFLAGALIYIFLTEVGWDFSTCLLGGIAYSLSYQLMIGSCWSNQEEMAIAIAFFLLTVEKIFHKKYFWGTIGVLICLFLFKMCFGVYQLLLYGGLCAIYLSIRLGIILVQSDRITLKKLLAVYGIAVGVVIVLLLILLKDTLLSIFQSDRFLNGFSIWKDEWENTISRVNLQNIATSYYRTIAPNIMGISWLDDYHGMPMQSCLDDGGFYVTILAVYGIVLFLDKRNHCRGRKLGALVLCAIFVMICFPGIRLLVNGFVNVTYKLSRLWMILFFGGAMLYAWQEMIAQKKDIHFIPLITTAIIVSVSLIIPLLVAENYLYVKETLFALIFLWAYIPIFVMWRKYPLNRGSLRYLFVAICCVEGISFNYSFVNNRDALTARELTEGYYNDGTAKAIEAIEEQEDGIYRINKSYQSVMLCDAVGQDYYSTTFYRGGVDNADITSFIKTFALPTLCNKMGYLSGTYGYSALSSILGVKYNITNDSQCVESGSRYIGEIEQKRIYANDNALPLVFGYQRVMTYEEFMSYSLSERHDIITQTCYVTDEVFAQIQNDVMRGTADIRVKDIEPLAVYVYKDYKLAEPLEFDTLQENEIAVIKVQDKEDKCVNLYWKTEKEGWYDKNFHTMSIYPLNGESFVELANQEGLQGIIFYVFDDKEIEMLDEVTVEIFDKAEYSKILNETTDELKENGIVYECATEQRMTGTLTMKQDGIIFVSIPYSAPYSYYMNGELADTICVNGIFTGIIAESGSYEIDIKRTDD